MWLIVDISSRVPVYSTALKIIWCFCLKKYCLVCFLQRTKGNFFDDKILWSKNIYTHIAHRHADTVGNIYTIRLHHTEGFEVPSRAHDSTHSMGLILSVSVSWPHNAWLPWLQANLNLVIRKGLPATMKGLKLHSCGAWPQERSSQWGRHCTL